MRDPPRRHITIKDALFVGALAESLARIRKLARFWILERVADLRDFSEWCDWAIAISTCPTGGYIKV